MNFTSNINLKLPDYEDIVDVQDLNDNFSAIDGQFSEGEGSVIDKIYPIGSVFVSILSTSPEILFGGEWEKVPDGLVLRSTINGETKETIGSDTISLIHTHTVNSHSHSNASHTHTSAAHTHTVASHTHSIGSHSHTIGGTTLTTSQIPSHNHSMASGGSHSHTIEGRSSISNGGSINTFEWWSNGSTAKYITTSSSGSHTHTVYSTGGGGSHTHSCGSGGSGTSGGTALTTASTTPGRTGGSGTWNTGNSAPTTNSALSDTVSIVPRSLTVYMWIRIS